MQPAGQPAAEDKLGAFKTIDEAGLDRHSRVLDYWLSIRGDREFPPLHDFDALAISDAGPCSVLLELIGGGEDAEIRHLGETLKTGETVERIIDAPRPSILASIAGKLSIVAISRNFLAFADEFPDGESTTRCWVTLLPMNSAGPWVDYVYAFVTFETVAAEDEAEAEVAAETGVEADEVAQAEPEPVADEVAENSLPAESEPLAEPVPVVSDATEIPEAGPGFAELFHKPATADGFYGAPKVNAAAPRGPAPAPAPAPEPAAAPDELTPEPAVAADGPLQDKLAAVRAKADEARMAKLRSNAALYEGLGAAYDFALDAEDCAEEYLKLVEAHGLKIQLRSPMLPVVKLAFDGMCDDATIARLEAVLAWALEQELPRGSLAMRIEEEGGIARILGGEGAAQ